VTNFYKIKYSGVIDADGHILEPPDLWENYLEERYKDRALRIKLDENRLEYLEIDGAPSIMVARGMPGSLGAMGSAGSGGLRGKPERTYLAMAPFGSMDAGERLEMLTAEGLESAVLYPTIGILWEAELNDVELTQAYCRAYNRWIVDFCRGSDDRLIPIAHLSLGDPAAAAAELQRAVADGCRGAFVVAFTLSRTAHGHTDHDALFAVAQDLDVPLAIHPSLEPLDLIPRRFAQYRKARLLQSVTASDGCRHAFTTFFDFGVFDRFPKLKLVVLESGAGWVGYWLDRLDAVYSHTPIGERVPLREPPSFYFRRQCFISSDPDENTTPSLIERFGADRFFWASDYPHADHTPDYLQELEGLAGKLDASSRQRFLGDNVRELYKIDCPR